MLFAVIIGLVAAGSRTPKNSSIVASRLEETVETEIMPSVDQLVEATVVADLAEVASLLVAANTANFSASLAIRHETMQSGESTISKPQLLDVSNLSRGLKNYTVVDGDNAAKIAEDNGISVQTLLWANDLKDESISVGQELIVPAMDGVVYTVKADDTVEALAEKYKSEAEKIVVFNDLELSGLAEGERILIPGGDLPETERPGYVAPVVNPVYVGALTNNPMVGVSAGNRYAYGYCTWYVYNRRADLGRPIGSYWGNATSWYSSAIAAGYGVGRDPQPGAIMQNSGGWSGLGHVAVVESIDYEAGTMTYSDMNGVAGWGNVGYRTITLEQAAGYNYIY